jgi:beta-N-acetylhexosaminidase
MSRDLERLAARMVGIGFGGDALTSEARSLIARGVRNVIFFSRNVISPPQFASLVSQVKLLAPPDDPLMTSIDQEGGRVMRLREPFTPVPSMRDVGRAGDEKLAYEIGGVLGREIRAVNVDVDLAPVLDVDTNPGNPVISSRSFGPTPQLAAKMGVALLRGLQDAAVAATAKHFPGHGDTSKDSHFELPELPAHDLDRLSKIELPPFEAAIKAGVACVMTAHVIYPPIDNLPATLSKPIIDGLLRQRLGFDGYVMSDDMEMKAIAEHFGFDEAIVMAVNAGVDLLWICHAPQLQNRAIEVLIHAVESGKVARERLEQASRRLGVVRSKFTKAPNVPPQLHLIGSPEHRAIAARIEQRAAEEDPTEAFVRTQIS